jgi:hypothetical protein
LVRDTIRITLLAQDVAEDHITFNKRNVVLVHIQRLRLEDMDGATRLEEERQQGQADVDT